ncbi:hypothetical protein [Sphingomonas crusticola]|uniref:hypothetical protein n=1 Tax=Sphingomonas crusticola TaxID=1697973 RepID=UPI000E24719D|nr:hypothetical protein [Sphingomonas crusticola]
MNPFEMVVLIVLIGSIAGVLRARYGVVRTGRGKEEVYVGTRENDAESERLRGEVRQLKDRIAVLERIVTDGDRNHGIALEREIEALRTDKEFRQ